MRWFQPGDVVQVRGSGPFMTVSGYDDPEVLLYEAAPKGAPVMCQWFDGDRAFTAVFDDALLVLASGVPRVTH
jgi:uncharacterized protein YodC (DUF2158 family)